jgi:hypothetical protein
MEGIDRLYPTPGTEHVSSQSWSAITIAHRPASHEDPLGANKTLNLPALQGPNCLPNRIFSKETYPWIHISCLQQLTDESFTEYQSFGSF